MSLVQRAAAQRSSRRLSALSARGVFSQHQNACQICLNESRSRVWEPKHDFNLTFGL